MTQLTRSNRFWPERVFGERFFDDFFAYPATAMRELEASAGFTPAVDVEETEKEYRLHFDLPGVQKDDVKIEVHEDWLRVKGERKSEKREEAKNRVIVERRQGSFERSFKLPSTVATQRITADFKDGVLLITVPKAEAPQPKLIKIS